MDAKEPSQPTITVIGASHAQNIGLQSIHRHIPPPSNSSIDNQQNKESNCPLRKWVNNNFVITDIYIDIKLDFLIGLMKQLLKRPPTLIDFPTTKLKKDYVVVGLATALNEKINDKLNWLLVKSLMDQFKKFVKEFKNTVGELVAGDDNNNGNGIGSPDSPERGEYRIIITNLSSRTTAKELRDWVEHEKLISVTVTDVYNRHGLNEGVVEFKDKADWDYAIRNLDHVKLDRHYVRVYDEREYNLRKLKVYDRPPKYQGGRYNNNNNNNNKRDDSGRYNNNKENISPIRHDKGGGRDRGDSRRDSRDDTPRGRPGFRGRGGSFKGDRRDSRDDRYDRRGHGTGGKKDKYNRRSRNRSGKKDKYNRSDRSRSRSRNRSGKYNRSDRSGRSRSRNRSDRYHNYDKRNDNYY